MESGLGNSTTWGLNKSQNCWHGKHLTNLTAILARFVGSQAGVTLFRLGAMSGQIERGYGAGLACSEWSVWHHTMNAEVAECVTFSWRVYGTIQAYIEQVNTNQACSYSSSLSACILNRNAMMWLGVTLLSAHVIKNATVSLNRTLYSKLQRTFFDSLVGISSS